MNVQLFLLFLLTLALTMTSKGISQTKPDTVTGIVKSPDGAPVVGALVQLFIASPEDQIPQLNITPHDIPGLKLPADVRTVSAIAPARFPLQTQTSDVNGRYIFYNVPTDNYTISIQQVTNLAPTSSGALYFPKQLSASIIANVAFTGDQEVSLSSRTSVVATFISKNGVLLHGEELPATATVFYATDRLRTPNAPPTRMTYTNEWNDGAYLDYGVCSVNVVGFREVNCIPLTLDSFLAKLSAALAVSASHKAILFSHGFNVSHDDAIRTGATFAFATKRVVIAYDWASAKNTALYTDDEDREAGSVSNVGRNFVERLATHLGSSNIALVGHSMGARATLDFAHVLADAAATINSQLQPVSFFAGDVFVSTVTGAMVSIRPQAPVVLSYDSIKDIPLGISLSIHGGNQRLGSELPQVALINGISVIDASSARTDWLGHGYLADTTLLSDFAAALNGVPPAARPHLEASPDNLYWIYRP